MATPTPQPATTLFTPCDPADLGFETTRELQGAQDNQGANDAFGQSRAVEALQLGLEIAGRGYNLFVLGEPGSQRHAIVRRLLEAHAATRAPPPDWCYVNNFDDPDRPRVLSLPPGEGSRLRTAMQGFADELGKAIGAALDSDEHRSRLEAIHKEFKLREDQPLQALATQAATQSVALLRTPQGFAFAPMKNGEPVPPEVFDSQPEPERQHVAEVIEALRVQLQSLLMSLPRLRREMQTRIRDATRDAMGLAAGHLIDELQEAFSTHQAVLDFLAEVRQDVIEAGEQLRDQARNDEDELAGIGVAGGTVGVTGSLSPLRYQVNLLVAQDPAGHAPVLSADNPTYANLVGRVDHLAHMGTLLTNFTLIRPGALHRANGGYLMLDAVRVLTEPHAWPGLKRALKTGQIVIESLPQAMGWGATLPLEPEPIALQIKIVMFGEREHYYLLQSLDPEFEELFRIGADFEDDIARDAGSTAQFAQRVAAMSREQGLRVLDRGAVARLVEHAARQADDAGKLSTHTRELSDLLHEADALAARAQRDTLGRDDIVQALAARVRRQDRLRDMVHEALLRDTLLIASEGEHVGQVNGLAVAEVGEFRFAYPVRVTATTRLGDGELVDIDRESTLGGPVHSKGVMILASFLGARFAQDLPLALSASLVFEQSYGPMEGDSASLAELCALLSALAFAPVRQSLAVTGSINQFGRVQAVGGVNEKIEGFFDLCRARGLTGSQGVLIPRANLRHLMLREDLCAAAAEGRFAVYAVDDVDEAIELLTGVPAGRPNAKGEVPPGTINHLVASQLTQFSLLRQAWSMAPPHHAVRGRARKRPSPRRRSPAPRR